MKLIWNIFQEDFGSSSNSTKVADLENESNYVKIENTYVMIISALGNSPLRFVADSDENPALLLKLLDNRYASSQTVSRIRI